MLNRKQKDKLTRFLYRVGKSAICIVLIVIWIIALFMFASLLAGDGTQGVYSRIEQEVEK